MTPLHANPVLACDLAHPPLFNGVNLEGEFYLHPQFDVDIFFPYISNVPTASRPVASHTLPFPSLGEFGDFTVQHF